MSKTMTRMSTRSWSNIESHPSKVEVSPAKKRKTVENSCDSPYKVKNSKSVGRDPMEIAQQITLNYNIDPYDCKDDVLVDGVIVMMRHYDLFRLFSFEETAMRNFIRKVKAYYNPKNIFHNFKHVWGVLHVSYQILIHGGDEYLLPLDIFAIMVAALCHDIKHPGNNNAFEAATASDLSKSKKGVIGAGILECHHATITNALLTADSQDSDILVGLNEEQNDHFRRQVSLIILGTDMAKHADILAEARSYASSASVVRAGDMSSETQIERKASGSTRNGNFSHSMEKVMNGKVRDLKRSSSSSQIAYEDAKPLNQGVDSTDPESRIAFTRVLVHTADIGAQTQSSEVALRWMKRCYGEFRSQAKKEELLGIVTSPFLHDLKEDNKTFSAQYSFIEETVEPLWTAMCNFLPKLAFAREQLVQNKLGYKRMLDDYLSTHQKGL